MTVCSGLVLHWFFLGRAISLQSVYTHVIVAQAGLPTHLLAPGPCKLMVTDEGRTTVTHRSSMQHCHRFLQCVQPHREQP